MFIELVMPSVGFDKRIMACIYHDSGGYRPVVLQTSFTALNIPWAPTIHPPCLYTLATIDLFPVSVAEAFPNVIELDPYSTCMTLCNPMNRSTPGLPVHHHLPAAMKRYPMSKVRETQVRW